MILELCGIFVILEKGIVKKILRRVVLLGSVFLVLAWIIDEAFTTKLRGFTIPSWYESIRPPFGEDMIYWIAGLYVLAYIIVIIGLYSTLSMRSECMMNDSFSFLHSISDLMWIFCTLCYTWIALYDLFGALSAEGRIDYTMFRKTAVVILLFRLFMFVYRLNQNHYYDLFHEEITGEAKALVHRETEV